MSNQIFNYVFNITGTATEVINNISQSAEVMNRNLSQSLNVFEGIKGEAVGFQGIASVVENINGAVSGIVEAGANAELQLINLKTLFGGNAEAAEDMYERIAEYGKVTPYDKAGLIEAQRTMMAFGISGERAFSTLKQIGDIAMGDSSKMQSLALAFAQMSSTGKLTGQDLLQMINAGFNPLNEISKRTGKSVAQLKEEMGKGAISVDMVAEAFRTATSEGGLFHGAIEEASNTAAGKMASIRDAIEEVKVKIFDAMGGALMWVGAIAEMAVPITQVLPLLKIMGGLMSWIKGLQWAAMWSMIRKRLMGALVGMYLYNGSLKMGVVMSSGFKWNMLQALWAVMRFATVGIVQGLKALGLFALSLLTTGGASTTFATMASGAFASFKIAATTACRAVGVAISSIPIVGWIAAAIAAIIAVGVYFWNTSAKFRAVLKGLWAAFKAYFSGIGELAKRVFGAMGDLIEAAFNFDGKGLKTALKKLAGGYADYGKQMGRAFSDAYNAELERSKKEEEEKDGEEVVVTPLPVNPTGGTLGSVTTGGESKGGRSVTVNIEKLVERFEIHTTNVQGDIARVKDMVSEALLAALNDVNLAM